MALLYSFFVEYYVSSLTGRGEGVMDGTVPVRMGAIDRALATLSSLFLNVEHLILVALGMVMSVTAVVALGSSVATLWDAMIVLGGAKELLHVVDRLLFVLMIAEILHTVRVSLQSGTLTCEPFLIVGLIASIRRVPGHHPGVIAVTRRAKP